MLMGDPGGSSSRIYRIKTDGSGKAKLSDDMGKFINVVGEHVYFQINQINIDYRMKLDGTEQEKITEIGYGILLLQNNGYIILFTMMAVYLK